MTSAETLSDLEQENAELKTQLAEAEQALLDLEEALTVAAEHGDIIEQQLAEANEQLHNEISDREAAQRRLQSLVGAINQQKDDLEILVGTLMDHGDSMDDQLWKELLASEKRGFQDGLTELANRRAFDDHLAEHFAACARRGDPISLLFADVDYFKQFNDHYGHTEGDECLKKVAQVIKSHATRPQDMAARYGGEEFAVVLPETKAEGALTVAESILKDVWDLAVTHEGSKAGQQVSISIGCKTIIPEKGGDPRALVIQADHRLYRAKQLGRNQVCAEEAG